MSFDDRLQRPLLMARTVAHLTPAQVVHRLRLRGLKAGVSLWPGPFERRWGRPAGRSAGSSGAVWPSTLVAVDRVLAVGRPSPEDNAKGIFEFLSDRRHLGDPCDWSAVDAPQLWRYHLHSWEWAWPFVDHPDTGWARDTFSRLWRSWRRGTTFGLWDEWSPQVVSLRVWVLCNLFSPLAAGTELETDLVADLGLHAGFVAANLELDVGGNHLIKNLKAAIALGTLLSDERLSALGAGHLGRQLPVQVLADGGHFELSPSYHAQVLGDLIDIRALLADASGPDVPGLDEAISRMRTWLGTMLLPDGDVAALNDSTLVGAARLQALGVAALGVAAATARRLVVLPDSGYAILRPDDRFHLLVDVGGPCPPTLPAHAQADCLTFELAIDGQRLIVDPGTSTYQPGARRAWERGTPAHNTVAVDGLDQTEVWGTFRAARLAHASLEQATDDGSVVTVTGSHDGYRRLAGQPRHRRTWEITARRLIIRDQVTGSGRHRLTSRLQLAPGIDPVVAPDGSIATGAARIAIDAPGATRVRVLAAGAEPGGVAVHFGHPVPAAAIELDMDADLPVAWTTTIDIEEIEVEEIEVEEIEEIGDGGR